jgi:hypothetical protein
VKKFLTTIILVSFLGNFLNAQVTFKASANKVVELGENFRLNYTVNANGSNFVPPDLSNFAVLAGPSTQTSTSFQIINGKTSQAISNTYSYIIQGRKEGTFSIGKAKITVNGTTYESNALSIEVVKGSSTTNTNQSVDGNVIKSENSNDIFASINLNKTTVYQGEQLIATLKIYDRAGLSSLNDYKFPSFTGFWLQDIEVPTRPQLQREKVKNKVYGSVLLRKSILFPQKSGNIKIDPFEVDCIIKEKAGQRRNFFGELVDIYKDVPKKLRSRPRTIKVLPLPGNKPASFTGAVGSDFKFNVTVDRNELKSNESVTMKVTVSGNGNMQIVDKIKINFPASFEIFDPKISNNIKNTAAGARGSKVFEYLVVPREPGSYTIPPIEFSYFDIRSKKYKVLTAKKLKFEVEKGDNSQLFTSSEGLSKEEVQAIGSDIRHIVDNRFELSKKGTTFFGSMTFYLFYIVAFVIAMVTIIVLRKKIKQNSNIALQKNKKANKISKKRLKVAAGFLKEANKEAFYDEVIRALWGYLSDKLNIPMADLSRNTVKETLIKRNIDENIINNFVEIIDNCEFAKYAPASVENQMEQDYDKARQVINKLVNVLS